MIRNINKICEKVKNGVKALKGIAKEIVNETKR